MSVRTMCTRRRRSAPCIGRISAHTLQIVLNYFLGAYLKMNTDSYTMSSIADSVSRSVLYTSIQQVRFCLLTFIFATPNVDFERFLWALHGFCLTVFLRWGGRSRRLGGRLCLHCVWLQLIIIALDLCHHQVSIADGMDSKSEVYGCSVYLASCLILVRLCPTWFRTGLIIIASNLIKYEQWKVESSWATKRYVLLYSTVEQDLIATA